MAKPSPKKTFVLSDESVNSYGFRVLTSGIDISDFEKNPIMLWCHSRVWRGTEDEVLPIGRWENLRVEGGKLLGDTNFDMDDPFAVKIANKVDKGFIKACSMGISILERSEAIEHIVVGQTRPTVTRCKLNEVSIADIPSNTNSISLYDANGNMIELTAESVDCTIGIINNQNQNEKNMKLIALKLGLGENATEAEIVAKLTEVLGMQEKLTEKDTEIAKLKAAALEADKKTIEKLVNDAVVAGKLTADQKPHFVGIGEKMGIESLQTTLSSMNGVVKPTTILSSGGAGASVDTNKKWADLNDKERETLRDEDKETYIALFEKEYGFKPEIN